MIGPGETFVAVIAIIAGCWMVASLGKHLIKWLSGEYGKETGADNSLTVRELNGLIQETIEEATAPLHARIERLEARLEAPEEPPLMPMKEQEEDGEERPAPASRHRVS